MSDIYRDPSEGAAAKRQDLLRRRRDELATMPHAIRRVVVARQARAAAGIAMTLGGVAMLATAMQPSLAERIDSMLPGVQPASISTMLFGAWLLALLAYMISRARSEHRFAVAMSHYVLPGRDLDYDLQRLDHERPDDMARSMAHNREVSSVAWLVLGSSLVLPATLLYAICGVRAHGWPVMREFETALAFHSVLFASVGIAGAIAALAMTTRAARAHRAIAIELALVAATAVMSRVTDLPIALAVVPFAMGVLAWRLVRERLAIAAVDPAAGSELFNLRDALRSTWRGVCAVGRVAGKPATLRAAVTVAVLATVFAGGSQLLRRKKMAPPAAQPQMANAPIAAPSSFDKLPAANMDVTYGYQAFTIDTTLDARASTTVDILRELPPHWIASLEVTSASGPIDVMVLPRSEYAEVGASPTRFETGCAGVEGEEGQGPELALQIRNKTDNVQNVKLTIKPTLTTCDR
jgi:hypothetical protein